ncbi:ANTAR domain-containing protein [Nakamurella sp. GG22]
MSEHVHGHPRLTLVPDHAERRRLDLRGISTGVRQLTPSVEPAKVLGQLAEVIVPLIADECTVAITEYGGHLYRIRQPMADGASTQPSTTLEDDQPAPAGNGRGPAVGQHRVAVRFSSTEGDCREYSGVLACRWTDGYQPTDADAGVIGLLVDHATAIVERHRLATQVADLRANAGQGLALPGHQRIAAAVGILMALHHLSAAQAADLLNRASEHTHQSIRGVADTVLRTGGMPDHIHHQRVRPREHAPDERGVGATGLGRQERRETG